MSERAYESSLNTWLAEALGAAGLDARPESAQGGGKRLDVEVRLDGITVALEAEQGFSTNKKASAIKDADQRLVQELADCAVAICYPDGLRSAADVHDCELIHSPRTHRDRPPARKAQWQSADIAQLARVIRRIPDQLGDPDQLAGFLSFSLDRAVNRLSEAQKQSLAACLDLPSGRPLKIEYGSAQTSRYNQATKRAMLVIATAVMFHAQLDKHRKGIAPLLDNRASNPKPFEGEWPPPMVSECAESDDPIGEFDAAWDLWLAVDYKPIFATARNALRGCAQDAALTAAVRGTAKASIRVVRNIIGLRHDLLGRIFHRVLETARYDGSFYTTTAAATLLATLAIREDMRDWSDTGAISRLRVTDPACGTGTLLMAAAERIRDLSSAARHDVVSRHLIENVLTGYDVNLTATHLAATTLGLLSPTTTFKEMKIGRALLGVENGRAYLGSLEFLDHEKQPRLLPWPTGIEQVETQREIAQAERADLVIMNPPFTRDSLRHDQFSRADELMLKAREKKIFDLLEGGIHRSHNGGGFLALADYIAKERNSTIAVVLPLVGATNYATREMRVYLAKKFHIDTIVTSHDPTRIYFSENTNIGEMLLVCRRFAPHPPAPSPTRREGEFTGELDSDLSQSHPAKWRISPGLERRMKLVARELRKYRTDSEDKLWQAIRKRRVDGRKFRRQVAIGAFVVDFYCSTERLAIEIDGRVHEQQVEADRIRQELIESLGIRILRLTNDEVEHHLAASLDKIRRAFINPKPGTGAESPLPRPGGGGLGVGEIPPTKIVNLYENPATPAAALGVARDIAEGNTEHIKGTVQNWPHSRIANGDWGGVQFLSPFLCDGFFQLRQGKFFETRRLSQIAEVGPDGRGIRGFANRSEVPDKDAMVALWYHKTDVTQKMRAQRDTYIHPKPGKRKQLAALWEKRGRLMISFRIFLPTIRCMSVRLNEKALGSLWIPCKPFQNEFDEEMLEKALCVYFNSTIGILAILGDRTNKKPTYPQMSMDDLRRIPVPDFSALSASQVASLAAAYDALCNFTLLPLPQIMEDETRGAIDRIVSDALGIQSEIVANIRRELAREPSVTGKPYAV